MNLTIFYSAGPPMSKARAHTRVHTRRERKKRERRSLVPILRVLGKPTLSPQSLLPT